MNFLEKLDLLMSEMSINKRKLSQLSGVPYTTIDGFYKKGYENTKISTIRKIASALNVSLDYLVDDNILERNFNNAGTQKSPASAEANTGEITLEESNNLLVALGYIKPGEQISDEDLSFLEHVIGLLDAWFDKGH